MSDPSGVVFASPLVRLPVELIEEIYVLSETHALPHVCQSLYIPLSSESARLRFCTRLFYLDNPRKDPGQKDACLRDKQIKILAQEWFTADFSIRIKAAVEHIRASDMIAARVRSNLIPATYSDTESNSQIHFSLFVRGVHLPARLLHGPWSQSKFDTLGQLFTWGLRMNPRHKIRWHESMRDAMFEDNWDALRSLLIIGPGLDRDGYKNLLLYGHGSIVRKLYNWLRDRALVWDDPELRMLVKEKGNREQGGTEYS